MTSPSRPRPVLDELADPARNILPPVECDPLASLSPTKITVDYLGKSYTVPAMTASQWLAILWETDFSPDDIFPRLVNADDDVIDAIVLDGVTPKEVFDVAMEILEIASGYRWWFAVRAAAMLKASWFRVGGFAMFNPATISLGLFLTSMLGQCIEHMEPKKAVELIEALNEVPDGYEGPTEEFADGAAFLAAMQQL